VTFPEPVPGVVIRYSHLWRAEQARGQEEGVKERPCAVVLVTSGMAGDRIVTVLPITHAPPSDSSPAVEIPAATKRRLGSTARVHGWFSARPIAWPGPDLRPSRPGDPASIAYGP
jgi:hypothetical protein